MLKGARKPSNEIFQFLVENWKYSLRVLWRLQKDFGALGAQCGILLPQGMASQVDRGGSGGVVGAAVVQPQGPQV